MSQTKTAYASVLSKRDLERTSKEAFKSAISRLCRLMIWINNQDKMTEAFDELDDILIAVSNETRLEFDATERAEHRRCQHCKSNDKAPTIFDELVESTIDQMMLGNRAGVGHYLLLYLKKRKVKADHIPRLTVNP